jgi:beta-glucosidase
MIRFTMPDPALALSEQIQLLRGQFDAFLRAPALLELFTLLRADRHTLGELYNGRKTADGSIRETQELEPTEVLNEKREALYPLLRELGFFDINRPLCTEHSHVLVLGGSSSPYAGVTQSDALGGATVVTGKEDDENDKDSGEGTDRSTLGYSGVQEELFRVVRAKAKKLVVVLIQGRPLVVDEIAAKADAVLLAWYPGSMGGQAVAEALYGEVNPSGRLPVSIPHSVGQIPVHSGGYAANRPRYIDGPGDAAYPFGYGLSYTTFAYSGLEVSDADEASVSVTNMGSRDGDEIVRLYFSVKGSGRQRPHRELLAFRRVSLKAGETRRVTLPFDRRLFGGYGRDGAYEPPHGEVSIWVDGCKDRVALRRLEGRGKACEGI